MPTRDLIIAFSGDEETAQATARDLVAHTASSSMRSTR